MSALEWLDAVRADLCRATPGPWDAARPDFRFPAHVITGGPSNTDLVATNVPERDARLIASAPDRLDRMERALRAALEAHDWTMHCGNVRHTRADAACDQCEAVCVACGERYPCPTVTTIRVALGDE